MCIHSLMSQSFKTWKKSVVCPDALHPQFSQPRVEIFLASNFLAEAFDFASTVLNRKLILLCLDCSDLNSVIRYIRILSRKHEDLALTTTEHFMPSQTHISPLSSLPL